MLTFDPLQDIFDQPEKFGCTAISDTNGSVLDGGINASGGWQAGKRVVLSLLLNCAEVTFDQIIAGNRMIPTLDVYLDAPVKVFKTMEIKTTGITYQMESSYGFMLTDSFQNPDVNKNVILASPSSLVGHLYQAGMCLPNAVQDLMKAGFFEREIFWGFSSMPIILRYSDKREDAIQRRIRKAGRLVSLWVRGADEEIFAYLQKWEGDGELRLHNTATGNTFVGGRIDHEELTSCLL